MEEALPLVGLSMQPYEFEYNDAAEAYLQRLTTSGKTVPVLCDALFIDEAQDMGPSTLKSLPSINFVLITREFLRITLVWR